MVRANYGHEKREGEAVLGNLKREYDDIYTDINYGPILTAHGLLAAISSASKTTKLGKVLCVGAGNAYEAVYFRMLGHDVYTCDYVAPKQKDLKGRQVIGDCVALPFKTNYFDYVQCCEMLEHVRPEDAYDCLAELYRVGTVFRFTIADKLDPSHDVHLCVKSVDWWRDMMETIGYNIYNIQIKPCFMINVKTSDGQYGVKEWYYPSGYLFDAYKN